MKWLLFGLLRLAFFAVLTFCFVVLYEYGPAEFSRGAPIEMDRLVMLVKQAPATSPPSNAR
jgi:hypothetical protein